MSLLIAGLAPHPPLLIPEIGRDRIDSVQATRSALEELCTEIADASPETLVLVTPHGPVDPQAVSLVTGDRVAGNFARFGAPQIGLDVEVDAPLTRSLADFAQQQGLAVRLVEGELDHGLLVPLSYLRRAGLRCPCVLVTISGRSLRHHLQLGRALAAAVNACGRHVALIASGDLSHRLSQDGPYGFDEMGPRFDRHVVKNLDPLDPDALVETPESMVRRAGVCGLRPLATLLGVLPREVRSRVLSYEGPFGVGYAVARLEPVPPPVRLARQAVEAYVTRGCVIRAPDNPEPVLREPRAAFVTLRRKHKLRGCIGTVQPICDSLAEEIIRNAVAACSRDPRFSPVGRAELPELGYEVSALDPPEPIAGTDELDPDRYGVYVVSREHPRRTGLLLPGIPQIRTVEQQLDTVLLKAGIRVDEPVKMFRFQVRAWD